MENESLILDLLEWIAATPKPYSEVMDAWRTSCPRLTIWEDALDAEFVVVRNMEVCLTVVGRDFLISRRNEVLPNGVKSGVT
jgi:hypothetical protein